MLYFNGVVNRVKKKEKAIRFNRDSTDELNTQSILSTINMIRMRNKNVCNSHRVVVVVQVLLQRKLVLGRLPVHRIVEVHAGRVAVHELPVDHQRRLPTDTKPFSLGFILG